MSSQSGRDGEADSIFAPVAAAGLPLTRAGSHRRSEQGRFSVGLGRGGGQLALPQFPQPIQFPPGWERGPPCGSWRRGAIRPPAPRAGLIGHVAFLGQPRQDLQDTPLGEFGTLDGPGGQVDHPGEATPVDVPAPAVAGAEPTGAAGAILTTAHAGLWGETGTMIWHRANRRRREPPVHRGRFRVAGRPAGIGHLGPALDQNHDPRRRIAHACYVHRRPAEP